MATFLTVKDAALRTGKSASSIRRILYPIVHDDAHPDRSHIEPSSEDALKLRVRGENFAWKISEELLARTVPAPSASEESTPLSHSAALRHDGDLVATLRRELDIKNEQITTQSQLLVKQMELISGLSERLREGNILIGSLQKQLAPPSSHGPMQSASAQKAEPVKSKPITATKTEKAMVAKPVKPKRGLWSRLFR